jgi:hypothetical protein
MRILILILAFILLAAVSNNQASVSMSPEKAAAISPELNKLLVQEQEKEKDRIERRQQLPAITSVFALHTNRERASRLAYLCYETTLDTPFKPIDLAELALAETGGHSLSSHAVSSEGALGVWQLMPKRAKSHGYKPAEMKQDEKCAQAAVKELKTKLEMAEGNLQKAKRLYCGAGPQARQYELKTRKYRRQIMAKMEITSSFKEIKS